VISEVEPPAFLGEFNEETNLPSDIDPERVGLTHSLDSVKKVLDT
jgi:hypothetical protein